LAEAKEELLLAPQNDLQLRALLFIAQKTEDENTLLEIHQKLKDTT